MKKIYLETRAAVVFLAACGVSLFMILAAVFNYEKTSVSPLLVIIPALVLSADVITAWFWLVIPYRHAKHMLSLFASGYSFSGISDARYPLNEEMEGVQKKVAEFLNTDQMMNLSKRQAQFIALQNQINPHFLYNTLEGIRSEALTSGLESVASMAEALSTFFRYTISQIENLVPLKMELDNTKNYFFIQQYRFGKRLHLSVEIDEEDRERVLKYKIPKLTLQPIVENSIIHGLEGKMGEGHLRIKVVTTKDRLLITVSDDGTGIEEKMLDEIRNSFTVRSFNYVTGGPGGQHSGIALQNVNNRIKILFGEEYGLSIESCPGVGTDVHISLPCTTTVSTEFSAENDKK
jgi:two-component system sensor histidine kinase YesM